MKDAFVKTITNGLRAATATQCDRWACLYRVLGSGAFKGPWTFDHHPWLRKMHQTRNPVCYGKKAAQMGYTETVLNIAFFSLDQLKTDVLYVLPKSKPDAADFSSTRFDVALEESEYIGRMFQQVKNVGLKRAGAQSLYIRGSRSRSALKSLPAGCSICDEYEEFFEGALPLIEERMSGQLKKQIWVISTPMVPNAGIDELYNLSNQQHFMFKCPHCGRTTELIFPECLVITADSLTDPDLKKTHLICKECQHLLEHRAKIDWLKEGFWELFAPNNDPDGFYINQLYSMTVTPVEIAVKYLKSQRDAAEEQEFWNSKIGEAHIVANAQVTDEQIKDAMRDYVLGDFRYVRNPNLVTTMGVDVGGKIHFCIMQFHIDQSVPSTDINYIAQAQLLQVGTVKKFDDLKHFIYEYEPRKIIIDDMPDTRSALAFIRQFPRGFGALCHYGMNATGKELLDYGERITANRTNWLDLALGRFISNTIHIPKNTPQEFKEHVKHLVKVYLKNADGETVAKYKKCGEDHFGHALTYAEMALPLVFGHGKHQDMRERVI